MARVLVVEPDRRIGSFISGILVDFGHQVERCGDLARAEQRLRRARFDVVATDLAFEDATVAPPRVLSLSGHPVRPSAAGAERPPRFNEKPFRFADLKCLVTAIAAAEAALSLVA